MQSNAKEKSGLCFAYSAPWRDTGLSALGRVGPLGKPRRGPASNRIGFRCHLSYNDSDCRAADLWFAGEEDMLWRVCFNQPI
jgi:hypothetical protein